MESIILILNLFILESLLSVDNAAVLAVVVNRLPLEQRGKALKWGIGGAFIFRGLCLVFAAWLIKIVWLKIAGGVYLLYLCYGHFSKATDTIEEVAQVSVPKTLWQTIILVEFLDLSFSIDNVFAAVAMTPNIYLIMIGVFMGIVAMRFIASWFSALLHTYPTLETSAFIVIGLLGVKLIAVGSLDYITSFPQLKQTMTSHAFDLAFSGVMMLIFIIPCLKRKKHKAVE